MPAIDVILHVGGGGRGGDGGLAVDSQAGLHPGWQYAVAAAKGAAKLYRYQVISSIITASDQQQQQQQQQKQR